MICNNCNSEPFEVMVKDEMGFATEAIELDIQATHCPFCGSDIEWAERGGFDAGEYDEDRLDV
jgi:transposase-like protein